MIGILITGHGKFAEGIYDATNMIVGKHDHYDLHLFEENTNLDTYKNILKEKIDSLLESCEGVLVLTDLKGGTPFNVSTLLSTEYENVSVLSGVNLPIAIEGSMHSQLMDSSRELAQKLIEVGKDGIDLADLSLNDDDDTEEAGDGI